MGKFKNEIELIHPNTSQHHLRLCGGFQFQVINQMMSGESTG